MMNSDRKTSSFSRSFLLISLCTAFMLTNTPQGQAQENADNKSSDTLYEKPYSFVKDTPTFPGGDMALARYIKESLRYPTWAVENEIEGRVICRFVVDKDGSVKDATIIRSLSPETDAEALRVVNNMPAWEPGKVSGDPVSSYLIIPIDYKLRSSPPDRNQSKMLNQNRILILIDGQPSGKNLFLLNPDYIESLKVYVDDNATEKLEKFKPYSTGKNTVVEITSREEVSTPLQPAPRKSDKEALSDVDELPSFPGGKGELYEYMKRELNYPLQALKDGIQGDVFCSFVVEADSSITSLATIDSLSEEINAEVVRFISTMPKWIPAKKNGVIVPAFKTITLPFRFSNDWTEDYRPDEKILRIVNGKPYEGDGRSLDRDKLEATRYYTRRESVKILEKFKDYAQGKEVVYEQIYKTEDDTP